MIVILMGVTGTGKTTVARALADRTGWPFAEGDDYHSAANRAKMHAGTPLTDSDRAPWLASLHTVIADWVAAGADGIMTCSALKQSYRDILAGDLPGGTVRFVLLEVPRPLLEDRLEHRTNHYMNPDLLPSQIATLETPRDALRIDASGTPAAAVDQIVQAFGIRAGK